MIVSCMAERLYLNWLECEIGNLTKARMEGSGRLL